MDKYAKLSKMVKHELPKSSTSTATSSTSTSISLLFETDSRELVDGVLTWWLKNKRSPGNPDGLTRIPDFVQKAWEMVGNHEMKGEE